MKTLVCILLIFAVIISCGIGYYYLIDKYMNTLNKNIDELEYAVLNENPELLKNALDQTESEWQKMRLHQCYLVKHEYIFEIDSAIEELYCFSKAFDSAEATLSVSKARAGASCIVETSSFTLENIL